MKSRGMIILAACLIVALLLCGCNEKPTGEQNSLSDKIIFMPSDVFKLIHKSLTFTRDKKSGEIVQVTVVMQFQNIADRYVNANVSVVFYDSNNTELYVGYREFSFKAGWTDTSITPANIVTYDGENVTKVDHVVITVHEIEDM